MIIRGYCSWAKLVKPGKGYDEGTEEWSIELSVDDATRAALEAEGLGDKIKNDDQKLIDKGREPKGDYIKFTRKTIKKDGTPSKPIQVLDAQLKEWDPKVLIGNGSLVEIKFAINEFEVRKKLFKSANILAVKVVNLVAYEGNEDFKPEPVKETQDW